MKLLSARAEEATVETSARERLAAKVAEQQRERDEAWRHAQAAAALGEEIEELQIVVNAEDVIAAKQDELRGLSKAAAAEADRCDLEARDLDSRAAEVDPGAASFERIEERRKPLVAELARQNEAMLSATLDSELRSIADARERRRRKIEELERETERLRKQADEATALRGDADALRIRAAESREQAADHLSRAVALPDQLPTIIAAGRAEKERIADLRRRAPKTEPAPIALGRPDLVPDPATGLIHGPDGMVINPRTGAVAWFR